MQTEIQKKLFTNYNELPSWARGVIVVGGLLVVGLSINGILRKFKREADLRKAQKDIEAANDALQELNTQGVVSSFTKSQYDAWANEILDAFKDCSWSPTLGSSLSSECRLVNGIFKQFNNDKDFLELVGSWNLRTYPDCGWWDVTNVTLLGAIRNELQQHEIDYLNRTLSQRLINYRV